MKKALDLLMLFQESYEGEIRSYDPKVELLGAENRQAVTCYLDALLFALFYKLDSFEAMLYTDFSEAPRKRLSEILIVWVNMLRSGKLITTDLVCLFHWVESPRLMSVDEASPRYPSSLRLGRCGPRKATRCL